MANISTITRIAAPVIRAFDNAEKANVKIGDAVLEAAGKLNESDIKPFCDAIKTSLENKGFTPNSAKVTTMYIRRVVTAIVVDGLEVEPGQTLRGLYDALPKSLTGGKAKPGARLPNPNPETVKAELGEADSTVATLDSRAEKVAAAVTMIFGSAKPEIMSAVMVAASDIDAFVTWAEGHAMASQLAELEKAVTATPVKRGRAKTREAVTA